MKRALTVGINYPGQAAELRGCVNDSNMVVDILKTRFGFVDSEITQVLDNDATTARMKAELAKLVDGARAGDVLFFHYSGHGSQMIDRSDDDDYEPDNLDEIICPVDLDWNEKVIRDDDLKAIFDQVPEGVNLTVFLDCCNSGGGVDASEEFITEVGEARDGISGSGRFLPPPAEIQKKINEAKLAPKPRALSRNVDNSCMLISGAQSYQTAADAFIAGEYRGATTYALNVALDELGPSATYYQLIHSLNRFMIENGFSQRPQLDGPSSLHHRAFLSAYDFGDPTNVAEVIVPEVTEPSPVPTPEVTSTVNINNSTTVNIGDNSSDDEDEDDDKKDNKKALLTVVGVAVAIGVILLLVL